MTWKLVLEAGKRAFGNGKIDFQAGNLHFSYAFGGSGAGKLYFFLSCLGVREAAGGRQVGRNPLE